VELLRSILYGLEQAMGLTIFTVLHRSMSWPAASSASLLKRVLLVPDDDKLPQLVAQPSVDCVWTLPVSKLILVGRTSAEVSTWR
jgi:hypothetical protein